MRFSPLRYMFARGVAGGIAVFSFVMLVSSMAGWNTGVFGEIVSGSAINQPASTVSFYLTALLATVIAGGVAGGVIGAINGLYTERYVKRYYTRIFDASDYAANLGWRTALLTTSLAVATVFTLMLSIFASLPGVALIVFAGVTGGLAGRGYAHHDMNQRREKKYQYTATDYELVRTRNRLEMDESEVDAAMFYDESLLEQRAV